MTKYNHAYTIAFAVPRAVHEDPHEALDNEVDKIINALLARVEEIVQSASTPEKALYFEIIEPFDTYEYEEES